MANWNPPPPYQQQYQPPYQPPRRRRGILPVVLVAGVTLVVVLIAAIIVVLVVRQQGDDTVADPPASTGAASPSATGAGALDECLIGNWRQTKYSAGFDLSGTLDRAGKPVGQIKTTGDGRRWKITATGAATETFDDAEYKGTATDGRLVTLTFTGGHEWKIKTSNGRILFELVSTNLEISVLVDAFRAESQKVNPQNNPMPYQCAGNSWTATSLSDATASTTFERAM
ncbi:hypothetical protein ACFO1B_31485 [Dactylosporangium siamense]|uniref:Uncharacterized protein n=1 Tax=Dactylosporangium siamense TaxID=685454 RepID=A0A919PRA8_9ACTN|nr:hypothetical protein [Dactylosporangium siamense]GIG48719.1 hypothetical protein Dsi01nite_067600 [Dactylosporangium siamense]